eukprot:3896815-Rhodomonas_salina.1
MSNQRREKLPDGSYVHPQGADKHCVIDSSHREVGWERAGVGADISGCGCGIHWVDLPTK